MTIYVNDTYRRLDDFEFSENNIIDYNGSDREIILPSYDDTIIIDSQEYVVEIKSETATEITTIDDYAFSSKNLLSVYIPEGIKTIANYAFYECRNLRQIVMPDGLENIGYAAFAYCINLIEINFPTSLLEIGNMSFTSCDKLTEVTIPVNVTKIGSTSFQDCVNLIKVNFESGSKIERIGNSTFSGCTNLIEVTIPQYVNHIGDRAFNYCDNLNTITIESEDIYKIAIGVDEINAGGLLANATTVRVLTTIVDTCDNSYLENTSNFMTSDDGEYTVFTKVN